MVQCCSTLGVYKPDSFLCSKYLNNQCAILLGKKWIDVPEKQRWRELDVAQKRLKAMRFFGLEGAFPASVCLFLYTFQFDALFEQECRKPRVHELPHLTDLVQRLDVDKEDRIRSSIDPTDVDDPTTARGTQAFRQKGGYNFVGAAAADAAQVGFPPVCLRHRPLLGPLLFSRPLTYPSLDYETLALSTAMSVAQPHSALHAHWATV